MSFSSEVLADSPLFFWKLDETSGTTAADASGNSKPGTYFNSPTLNQASLIPSEPSGKSISTVAASAQTVFRSSETALNPVAITVMGTFFITGNPGSGGIHTLAAKDSFDAVSGTRGWVLYWNESSDLLTWSGFITAGTRFIATAPAATMARNVKHLFHATYDGTTAVLYVDGVSAATASLTGSLRSSTFSVQFGKDSTSGSKYATTAGIDAGAMWNSALSSTRVSAHYAAWQAQTATASLSLSASGDAQVPLGGAASLALSSTSVARAPVIATAALTLSATGSSAAPMSGTASIAMSALGVVGGTTAATGSASLSITASGGAVAPVSGAALVALTASGAASSPMIGLAAIDFTASASAATLLAGDASLDLTVVGLVSAPAGGTAYLVLTAEGVGHAPFRDVKVLALVDVSRLVTFGDLSRLLDLSKSERPRALALTDRSQ